VLGIEAFQWCGKKTINVCFFGHTFYLLIVSISEGDVEVHSLKGGNEKRRTMRNGSIPMVWERTSKSMELVLDDLLDFASL
jgi:hypothetical protein